ncbi:splicing component [Theileria orientalis]|uniref:Pre-mRNA-splicing factor 38 n=1 Tax=Theileria orientalis TaxID=68886 RepID=A0A976SKW5_THEOR|nr:splicing component [Theileria orientalis]
MADSPYTSQTDQPSNKQDNETNVIPQQTLVSQMVPPIAAYPIQPNLMQQYNYMGYYNYPYYMNPQLMYQYQNQPQIIENSYESVQKCHLHSKPDLNCKFCRKFKSAVHEISRLAHQKQVVKSDDRPNQLPMTNSVTYNMNDLLRNNILASEYYKSLSVKTFHDVVNELVQFGSHCEPYCSTSTRAPSTMFCCLYKFFTLKLTEKQMVTLLDHNKSPYPRCCGFLYLRYVLPADKLWSWYEPYFLDEEEFTVSSDGSKQTTVGEFAESLIMDDKYYNTVLPRLPVRVKNLFGAHLLEMSKHRKRRVKNMDFVDDFVEGAQVSVCSKGDWLDGEILTVKEGRRGFPLVTVHLEDGTDETVDIGYVVLKDRGYEKRERHISSRSSSLSSTGSERRRKHRRRSHDSHSKSDKRDSMSKRDDLLKEFKRREREKVLATGKEKCTGGYPLRIELKDQPESFKILEQPVDHEFVKKMLPRLDYNALYETAKSLDLALPRNYVSEDTNNDHFISAVHHALFNFHILEGRLVCPSCSHNYKISKGIPDMLHKKEQAEE